MIASDKQIVHMYVNVCLASAGGLIKQTIAAADWSLLYSFFRVVDRTLTHFFSRLDGKLFLTSVPILPCFLNIVLQRKVVVVTVAFRKYVEIEEP